MLPVALRHGTASVGRQGLQSFPGSEGGCLRSENWWDIFSFAWARRLRLAFEILLLFKFELLTSLFSLLCKFSLITDGLRRMSLSSTLERISDTVLIIGRDRKG